MTKKEITKRYILFVISLFFAALGVAITKHGELGVSPISSVANVLSCKYTNLSLGTWLIIWNCVLIVGQIVLLRKNFEPVQLLQIPLSFLFGYFTNFGNIKIGFDVICVIIAVVLSLIFFHGELIGTREGTILSALLTGAVVKLFTSVMKTPLENIVNETK